MEFDWKSRITLNPAVLAGKPTIRGLRIGVEHVLQALANDISKEELIVEYPDLDLDDIRACQAYAADLVANERVYPVRRGA